MKSKFFIILFIFSLSFVSSATYYNLNLTYDKGDLILNSFNIEIFPLEKENIFGFWLAEVTNFENEILNLTFFDLGNQIFWDEIDPETGEINNGGIENLDYLDFNLYIPYYENAQTITIFDDSLNEVLEIDVSMYSKEISSEISKDSLLSNQSKSELIPNESPTTTSKIKSLQEKIAQKWWILLIILATLIIILLKSIFSKKSKHLPQYQNA